VNDPKLSPGADALFGSHTRKALALLDKIERLAVAADNSLIRYMQRPDTETGKKEHARNVRQCQEFDAAMTELREHLRAPSLIHSGYRWEIYHVPTGEVCNSGFVRGESAPTDSRYSPEGKLSKEFAARCIDLFERASSPPSELKR
jgi:hypothetical protein